MSNFSCRASEIVGQVHEVLTVFLRLLTRRPTNCEILRRLYDFRENSSVSEELRKIRHDDGGRDENRGQKLIKNRRVESEIRC